MCWDTSYVLLVKSFCPSFDIWRCFYSNEPFHSYRGLCPTDTSERNRFHKTLIHLSLKGKNRVRWQEKIGYFITSSEKLYGSTIESTVRLFCGYFLFMTLHLSFHKGTQANSDIWSLYTNYILLVSGLFPFLWYLVMVLFKRTLPFLPGALPHGHVRKEPFSQHPHPPIIVRKKPRLVTGKDLLFYHLLWSALSVLFSKCHQTG